ncbi:MAG: polyketide synthase module, partial [Verrucomicrobiales bacterium]|nr:polyketide synthase module [Verrucomicrobiales bacterium]
TKLGDPVEIQGIKLAFKKFTDGKGFCAVGSAKAHLGHTESAAGIVGVIKTILAMKNHCIPAMPDFKELNPLIQLKESPLYINTASKNWESVDNNPLRAGVSSFGFGGTYAHVVLESFESARAVPSPTSQPELFVFSARTSDRLEALLKKFSSWLEDSESQGFSFSDIAFTLQTGREQMDHRFAFVASSHLEALQRISGALENKRSSNLLGRTVEKNPVVRIGQSPEDLRYFQSLYTAGHLEKLAALWIWGAEIPWQKVRVNSTCHRIPMPTYEFERKSFWFISRGEVTNGALLEPFSAQQVAAAPNTDDLRSFVTNSIARLLSLPASEIHPATHLQDIGFDSIMGMQLMKEIQENFNVRFYPSEAQLNSSLGALLDYLESQVNPPLVSNSGSNSPSVAKKQLAFVLSAPRSGSTLLRVMLAGHSGIFCPPELHLLPFSTLEERSRLLSARAPFLSEGLPRAIMELRQCDANLAVATVNEWQQKGLSTPQIYDTLRGLAGERIVIDKSPSYAEDLKVLERSHAWFPDAKYIFLYRHPFAVMESYVRNRFDKLFQQNAADPWQAAADVWCRINRNLRALRNQLPPSNYLEIRYEDLVAAPETVSRKICTFLEIPFEPALLRPYEGKRMTDGLRPVSLSIGDPNFNDHQEIDPALAEGWRSRLSTMPNLSSEAAALARELGYSIENLRSLQLAPAQELFLRTYGANPIWNLEHRFIFETVHLLDRERFENAWRAVIARHPTFRTCFSIDLAQLEQREILRPFSVEWSDFSRNSAEERELGIQEVISALHRSINLHEPPLIRCGIVDIGSGKYQMVCVYHHLIGDGISSAVLFEEVLMQYLAPSSAAPFEHAMELYSQRVNQLVESAGPEHEAFWREHLENYAYSNPPMEESTAPALFSTELEMRFVGEYLKLPIIPSFTVAAAALYQVIAEWGDSTDVVIGHRLHGRVAGSGRTEDPIGCFAIDIPLRLKKAELESANVVTAFRTAFEQIPSNGTTYAALAVLGKLPAADKLTAIRLNYQPRPLLTSDMEFKLISQTVHSVQAPEHQRQYLLDFIVRAQPDSWSLIVRYSTTRHREDTIRRLVGLWSARVRSLSLE